MEPQSSSRSEVEAAVSTFIEQFLDGRATAPAAAGSTDPEHIKQLLALPGDSGTDISSLLNLAKQAFDTGFDTASGRFLAYIPSGGLFSAALGTYLGSVVNRFCAASHVAPGMVAIEQSVIGWMTSLFQLGEGSGGLLLSGGSVANLTALVTARSRLGERFDDGVIYTSVRAHHSVIRGARIAGISPNRVRLIETDDRLRLDVRALEAAIVADGRAGLRPMMIAATAGTTDTGAIDPLTACAEVAEQHGTWLHVDAAYGGFFQLTDRGKQRLTGIERADSITVDAHKSLFLPFGFGGLLVRDVGGLVDAHQGQGAYMQDVVDGELPHYMAMGPEQTRPNRGLPIWLALNLHGVEAFRETLDSMLDLTQHATQRLRAIGGMELITEPELSVVAFRSLEGDERTSQILETLNQSGRAYVSSTTIGDRLWIRLVFLSQRTTIEIVDDVIDLVVATTGEVSTLVDCFEEQPFDELG